MFDPTINVSWSAGLLWLAGIALASFLVSWSLSELRPSRRVIYIPVLALVTGVLTAGYLLWSEAGLSFWTNEWIYGLVGAVLSGGLLTALLSRRVHAFHQQVITARTAGWDGLVYGAAEGLLLSVLPVVVTWQMLASNGWTSGWRNAAAGVLAISASVAVIVIHHLGYPDYRSAKMGQAVLGCGILSIAYFLSASVVAAILAHAWLHIVIVRKGMELPPHEEAYEITARREISAAA
jgi:hypothetical protein